MTAMRDSVLAGTDDGLAAIGARFSVAAGLGIGQGAAGALDGVFAGQRLPPNPVRQVPLFIPVPLSGGDGTFTGLIGYQGPPIGYYWSIRRLTAQGFTAGTVIVYESSVDGETLFPFPQAGTLTASRGEEMLHPQSYIVVQASGITGTVTLFGAADAVPDWYLSRYLG
jgi:hypothetical protein